MEIKDLVRRHEVSRETQQKAIFASFFIMENRLQTIFDKTDPMMTLKQFMLLVMLRQSEEKSLTLTQLGGLLGCSRQNIKKLAMSLEAKGFVTIQQSNTDKRKSTIVITHQGINYFSKVLTFHNTTLNELFADYTDDEVGNFFMMMMKLYPGIERLEDGERTEN